MTNKNNCVHFSILQSCSEEKRRSVIFMQQVETLQKTKTHFSLHEATNENAYASIEAWQNFCQRQKKLGLDPSPLALGKLKLQHWWQENEVTADAAWLITPHQQKSLSEYLGDFYFVSKITIKSKVKFFLQFVKSAKVDSIILLYII